MAARETNSSTIMSCIFKNKIISANGAIYRVNSIAPKREPYVTSVSRRWVFDVCRPIATHFSRSVSYKTIHFKVLSYRPNLNSRRLSQTLCFIVSKAALKSYKLRTVICCLSKVAKVISSFTRNSGVSRLKRPVCQIHRHTQFILLFVQKMFFSGEVFIKESLYRSMILIFIFHIYKSCHTL